MRKPTPPTRHQQKTKTTWYKVLLLALLIVIIGVMTTWAYYYFYSVIEVKYIKYDFYSNSSTRIGINLDEDAIHFGTIPLGLVSRREVIIHNDRNESVLIGLSAQGQDQQDLLFDNPDFLLVANESRSVMITAAPKNTGSFTGNIVITIKHPTGRV